MIGPKVALPCDWTVIFEVWLAAAASCGNRFCYASELRKEAAIGMKPVRNQRSKLIVEAISKQRLKKARALFFYLICTPGQPHRNEKVIDLLWQQSAEKQAAASFRQTIRQVRLTLDELPDVSIETGMGQIVLNWPDRFDFLSEVAELVRPGKLSAESCDVIRFCLAQIDTLFGFSSSLDSWLVITRNRLQSALRTHLDETLSADQDPKRQRDAAEFAIELDPANENATRHLMRHHWQAKAPTQAIGLYYVLQDYLDEHYDQEPEVETAELLAAIKLDPDRQDVQADVKDIRPKLTVSVNPSDDLNATDEDRSLIKVLAADLRRRLSRFREWQVLDEDHMETAFLVLHLQLMPVAGSQTLHVEVTRPDNGELVWSDAIAGPTKGWDEKVHPVLVNIANALSVEVAERSPASPAADTYDYWLRSQTLLDAWSPETESKALTMLRKVTAAAPKFGPAHAELAGALNVRHVLLPGTYQTEDVKQAALHHAIEAVTIDPLDTRAHRVLAWCYCHKGDFELAEFHFEQALSLNENNPLTLASAALGFAFTDRLDRAAELARLTRDQKEGMQPFHKIYLAATAYLNGNYAEAVKECEEGEGLMTTVGGWETAALWNLGRSDEAVQRFDKFRREIEAIWSGAESFTEDGLISWFVSIFPLRQESVRDDLKAVLQAVLVAEKP